MEVSNINQEYLHLIETLKSKIRSTQTRTALAINQEVLKLYWEVGNSIVDLEKKSAWGDRLYQKISADLFNNFPGSRGYSPTNLKRMRLFAEAYPDFVIGARHVHQLPWGHIVVLLHKAKQSMAREWYAVQALENGWSRDRLAEMINSDLYSRQAISENKSSNFRERLHSPQSEMAHEMQKNPYNFDFMGLLSEAKEREIEISGINDIRNLIMELGKGFAFLGNQVPMEVDGKEYFLDLLFYHVKLHCYVVVELKTTAFEPEHAGKLNFYLTVVDNQIKMPEDHPSIGLLLCKSHSKIVAEYSLKSIDKPIGISNYELTKKLPEMMKGSFPSIEELEEELESVNLKAEK